jgi:hypothetical protein
MFPDARFVHIVRDPYPLFGSTVKLWKTLYKFEGLQVARHDDLEEHVFSTFEQMYDKFERDRQHVPSSQLFEVRYEDLVQDPIERVRAIYEHFGLGEFATAEPKLREYFKDRQGYQIGKYQIPDELRETIDRRWGPYMRKYGYCQGSVAAS